MNDYKSQQKLHRVSRPLVRGTLTFDPVEPLGGSVTDGPLIRATRPVVRGAVTFVPVVGAHIELTLPIISEDDGNKKFDLLNSAIGKLNELEALFDRPGVSVIGPQSGLLDDKVVIFIMPNEPTDAIETCKRMADWIFATVRTLAGVAIRVLSAESPDKPLYKLAV
jgi:hypothetical protein